MNTFTPKTKTKNDGIQEIYEFENGYGASVIQGPYSYGGTEGLWELAVLDSAGHLNYDTPITSDVLGYLSRERVEQHLAEIAALPAREAASA